MVDEISNSVIDVLLFLFENYFHGGGLPASDQLAFELKRAGFTAESVEAALETLENLNKLLQVAAERRDAALTQSAIRVFTPFECGKLDVSCRGFLLFLEQLDIVNVATREWIIEQVMALDTGVVDMDQLRDMIVMGLLQQTSQKEFVTMPAVASASEIHTVH